MSKVVYLYNLKNRMHEFLGAENVDDNAVLTDGQTLVAPQSYNSYWDGQNWVSNSDLITIYHYDSNGNLDNLEIATKNATLSANETTVKPSDENGLGMYRPKFDVAKNKWVETLSKEEIEELNKTTSKEPNNSDQAISALTAQLLQTQMTVKQQGTQIASLTGALLANAKKNN
ncbi:hypothetical protein [Limosilactobacillus mucosae]|uniref:hypothetical protein n=1 Tax=Limosilactobacillus mucosae TaxID=97478 RepID=UPI0022DEF5A7|nr:hypothetical protein [Limosilactobacillus mucosae]